MVYGTQIAIVCYSYSGESKPTNITGGPHIVELLAFAKMFSDPMLFRITGPKKKPGRCDTRTLCDETATVLPVACFFAGAEFGAFMQGGRQDGRA